MQKVKVAEFFGEPLNYGGQEAFISNVYSKINKSKFDFTFITPFECENTKLQEMINNNNDNLIVGNNEFNSKLRKKYIINMAKKYLNNTYDVVHIHSGSVFTLYNVAKIAKKSGIKKVIVHSHATGINNIKYKIIKFVSDRFIGKYVDLYFACSKEAGMWKFPKKILDSKSYYIIKNGVDLDLYSYNEKTRNEYRKKFNITDELVLINVGRFSFEKNQMYIIDIFKELLKLKPNSILFLVGGEGDLLVDIKNKINNLGLNDKVQIMINRSDVNNLINMSDVFILPSVWEGLPFTGIEAQTNGIPCIFSNNITKELNISKSYNSLSIDLEPIIWAKKIIDLSSLGHADNISEIRNNGYDIFNVCKFLEKVYGESNVEKN